MAKKKYSPRFQAKAVADSERDGVRATADRIGVHKSQIYDWRKKVGKSTSPRKSLKRYSVAGWIKFALAELRKERPSVEVAQAYLVLAEQAMMEEAQDG